MKAVIYSRMTKQSPAIAANEAVLMTAAKEKGWDVVDRYLDVASSGISRLGLNQMLEDIKSKNIDLVLSYSLDRLSRDVGELKDIFNAFEQNGVKFWSMDANTITPEGKLALNAVLAGIGYFSNVGEIE